MTSYFKWRKLESQKKDQHGKTGTTQVEKGQIQETKNTI
jgi:hypothetical protein